MSQCAKKSVAKSSVLEQSELLEWLKPIMLDFRGIFLASETLVKITLPCNVKTGCLSETKRKIMTISDYK